MLIAVAPTYGGVIEMYPAAFVWMKGVAPIFNAVPVTPGGKKT
jgi:hypothetical protein